MPELTCNFAIIPYLAAWKEPDRPFLFFYQPDKHKRLARRAMSRGQFWQMATRAASVLKAHGLGKGSTHVHYFTANHPADLAFRLAATLIGSTPVTINWQADSAEAVRYKIELTEASLLIHEGLGDELHESMRSCFPELRLFSVTDLGSREAMAGEALGDLDLTREDAKIVIFTSGTTGRPKGVRHAYRAYDANAKAFDSFLGLPDESPFDLVVVNPLHHANATAMSDWAMRKPGARLHLIAGYTTDFWRVLADIGNGARDRVILPAVARHFDFLERLEQTDGLPLPLPDLKTGLNKVEFLLGSAPVGPSTVQRLERYSGKPPLVRFGSTETCLQVLGTPATLSVEARRRAFQRGWDHQNGERPGYWIGRPHEPHTEVRLVASVEPGHEALMRPVAEGKPGYLVARGENLMMEYVRQPDVTASVFQDGWYTGLADIGFYLLNPEDGQPDYYWMGRESAMLIRGGANYAYDQINTEIRDLLQAKLGLGEDDVDLAVVGLRWQSEHEDSACLSIELKTDAARALKTDVHHLLSAPQSREALSKAARPDFIRFASVPRNFKGAVSLPELKKQARVELERRLGAPPATQE